MSFFSKNTDYESSNVEATQIVANKIITDFVNVPIIQSTEVIIEYDNNSIENVFTGKGTVSSPLSLPKYKIHFYATNFTSLSDLSTDSNLPINPTFPGKFVGIYNFDDVFNSQFMAVFSLKYAASSIYINFLNLSIGAPSGDVTCRIYSKDGNTLFPSTSFPNEIPSISIDTPSETINNAQLVYEFQDNLPENTEFIILMSSTTSNTWVTNTTFYYTPVFE